MYRAHTLALWQSCHSFVRRPLRKVLSVKSGIEPENKESRGTILSPWKNTYSSLLILRRQRGPQPGRDVLQRLRKNGRAGDDGHEINVAFPPRHHVDVQMFLDARARDFAKIDAHVEAF